MAPPLVLLVDNNRLVLDLVETFLRGESYDVIKAGDGLDAIDLVARTRPDVIVTDLIMPRVDGKKLCRYLRQNPLTRSIPIIVLSGTASEDRMSYREVEADAYLAKCSYDKLLPNIKSTLERLLADRQAFERDKQIIGIEQLYPRELVKEFTIIKKHYDAILENMGEGVLEADRDGRVILANPAAQRILGRSEDQLIGGQVLDVLDGEARAPLGSAMAHLGNEAPEPRSVRVHSGEKALQIGLSPISWDGATHGLFLTMEDVTHEEELEAAARDHTRRLEIEVGERTRELEARNKELEEANRVKDEFLGVLSHELRTPITPIKGYIELMRDNPGDVALARKALLVLRRQADHLERMLTDLLDLTAVQAGRIDLSVCSCDARASMNAAVERLASLIGERSSDVALEIPETAVWVRADGERLEQVLSNLLANALKFSPEGSTIGMGLRCKDGRVEAWVRDRGPGIAEKDRALIFERFRQVDGSLTRRYSGLGIGLTLAKALVDLMGAVIRVDSAEGSGSTFTVELEEAPPS